MFYVTFPLLRRQQGPHYCPCGETVIAPINLLQMRRKRLRVFVFLFFFSFCITILRLFFFTQVYFSWSCAIGKRHRSEVATLFNSTNPAYEFQFVASNQLNHLERPPVCCQCLSLKSPLSDSLFRSMLLNYCVHVM